MKRPIKSYDNKVFNGKRQKELRKRLRNTATHTEMTLWKHLRNRQINGYKFRRQYSVGPFVVDFYCPELKLVIELDGANHFFDEKSIEYDTKRQKFIEFKGLKVLRITTAEVCQDINSVVETILAVSKPPLGPSLERRGTTD